MNTRPLLGISLTLTVVTALLAVWLLPTERVQAASSVSITDNAFAPQTLTVPVGETVTWTNNGVNLHTATGDRDQWNSGTLSPGASFSFKFVTPGTYTYYCSFHNLTIVGMTGTIVVLSPTSTPVLPTATPTPLGGTPTPTATLGPPHTPSPSPVATPTRTPVTGTPTVTPTPIPFQITLVKGWNLISLNGRPDNTLIASVFADTPEVTQVYAWQFNQWVGANRTAAGEWTGPLKEIRDGVGYWVNASDLSTLSVKTRQPVPETPPLSYDYSAGWNLIGFVTQEPTRGAVHYLSTLEGKWTIAYSYDQTYGFRATAPTGEGSFTDFVIGRGYWVYLTANGVLVL